MQDAQKNGTFESVFVVRENCLLAIVFRREPVQSMYTSEGGASVEDSLYTDASFQGARGLFCLYVSTFCASTYHFLLIDIERFSRVKR